VFEFRSILDVVLIFFFLRSEEKNSSSGGNQGKNFNSGAVTERVIRISCNDAGKELPETFIYRVG